MCRKRALTFYVAAIIKPPAGRMALPCAREVRGAGSPGWRWLVSFVYRMHTAPPAGGAREVSTSHGPVLRAAARITHREKPQYPAGKLLLVGGGNATRAASVAACAHRPPSCSGTARPSLRSPRNDGCKVTRRPGRPEQLRAAVLRGYAQENRADTVGHPQVPKIVLRICHH